MLSKTKRVFAISTACLIAGCTLRMDPGHDSDASWLYGRWEKISDEDPGPADTIRFDRDGTYATYDAQCRASTNPYFIRRGLVFMMAGIPGKGPVALVLKPGEDRASLTFTSPRTLHNAVYGRAPKYTCGTD